LGVGGGGAGGGGAPPTGYGSGHKVQGVSFNDEGLGLEVWRLG
jgi:hypothetical protein